jgi:hypothetical protein
MFWSDVAVTRLTIYLLEFALKRAWKHIREKLQGNRKQELHEWHNDEDSKGNKAQQVGSSPA